MILFAEDWKNYPTAILHTNTTNKSFVRLAALYRQMGVKNHAFLLALVNPELEFVDPYSEDLTEYQMHAINVECSVNPWYFFRECVRVPSNSGSLKVKLEANRGNIALFWCFFNHIMVFLIQPRQTGKSFNSDVIDAYLLNVGCVNTQINLLTKDDTLRRKNIERLRNIIKELPPYISKLSKIDSSNFEEITIRKLGNSYIAHVPQASEKAAYKLGRGLSTAVVKIDEPPFQPNIDIAVGSMLGATGAAVDSAIANGEPYGVIFTTTAGKLNDPSGKYVYGLLSDATIWDERVLDSLNEVELGKFVKRNNSGRNYRINLTFNHRQLGKTDEWLYDKISGSTQSGEDADRDFFNRWTSGSTTSPISAVHLDRMSKAQRPHEYAHISPPYDNMTLWYIKLSEINHRMANSKVIIGLDTSDAAGGDGIEMYAIDADTAETIFTGTFNELNLIEFSYFLCELLVAFTNTTLVIERRSSGATIIDYLLKQLPVHGIDPFRRLYNRVVHDALPGSEIWNMLKTPVNRRHSQVYIEHKSSFGFATSGAGLGSRSDLYGTTLQKAIAIGSGVMYSTHLVNQVSSLITKNGRIDHPPGGHDDAVIAWLIANWFILNGNNLAFYGIDKVLTRVKMSSEDGVASIIGKEDPQQIAIKAKIEELSALIENTEDQFLILRYENQLKYFASKVVDTNTNDWSVDSLMKRIKEKKMDRKNKTSSNWSNNSFVPTNQVIVSDKRLTVANF